MKTYHAEVSDCSRGGCDRPRHPIFSFLCAMQAFLILWVQLLDELVLCVSPHSFLCYPSFGRRNHFSYQGSSFLKTHVMGPCPARNLSVGIRACKKHLCLQSSGCCEEASLEFATPLSGTVVSSWTGLAQPRQRKVRGKKFLHSR